MISIARHHVALMRNTTRFQTGRARAPTSMDSRQGRHSGDAAQAAQELGHLALQLPILRDLWPQHHLGTQCFGLAAEGLSFPLKLCNSGCLAGAQRHALAQLAHLQSVTRHQQAFGPSAMTGQIYVLQDGGL